MNPLRTALPFRRQRLGITVQESDFCACTAHYSINGKKPGLELQEHIRNSGFGSRYTEASVQSTMVEFTLEYVAQPAPQLTVVFLYTFCFVVM